MSKPPPRNPFGNEPPPLPPKVSALKSPLLDPASVTLRVSSPSTDNAGGGNPFDDDVDQSRLNPFGADDAPNVPPPRIPVITPAGVSARGPSVLAPKASAVRSPPAVEAIAVAAEPVFSQRSNPFGSEDSSTTFTADEDNTDKSVRHSDIIPRQSHSKTSYLQAATNASIAVMLSQAQKDDMSSNTIYYKNTLSDRWLLLAIIAHIIQWGILLDVSRPQMTTGAFGFTVFLVVAVVALLIGARVFTVKKPRIDLRKRDTLTPDDEADNVRPIAVHMLAIAACLEGLAYAIFTSDVAGRKSSLSSSGFYSQNTVIQTLQFASITFLTFHRSIRPSNRCDPLRTMLELEVVSVCWDALDGSTIFMLLNQGGHSYSVDTGLRILQAFWYLSVGGRTAYMYAIHLPPTSPVYQFLITRPLQLATTPTVDRTLQSLRQRSVVTLVMSLAELYAMCLRIFLWSKGQLDTLQIEMAIKNCLFLFQMYSAADMYFVTNRRDWNSRELGFGLYYPSRERQLSALRAIFVSCYVVQGCLLSVICSKATQESFRWIGNFAVDVILATVFFFYCRNCHLKIAHEQRNWWQPQFSYVIFPVKMAIGMSCVMAANLFVARIPTIYASVDNMAAPDSGELWTYSHSLLVVMFSVLTIGSGAMYWYLSHMLFHKEFTASPGDYNAIHDPTISMVAISTQIEGALDVLSCVTLMQLAPLHLPDAVNGAVKFFCLFELFNASQSFALQVLLAGGQDDTPLDLVKWKAWLRALRGLIDFGCFILRLVLWIQYNALSSVFLIKNLYNLLHTYAQIERYVGVTKYPKYTLFTESVAPQEWYGLTKQEWRDATRATVVAQAQAGRAV